MSRDKLVTIAPVFLVGLFALLRGIIYYNYLLGREVYLRYDEAIYAILSQRFLAGDFLSAFNPYWNSGFPLATIPFYLLTASWETSQFLVSVTSHILLIFVMYFTLKKISHPLAIIAAFLAAFSPTFLKLVVAGGITEPLYILLLWLGIYFGWQAIATKKVSQYALSGFFFGSAYLTRTEAMYTFAGFCAIAFLSLTLKRRKVLSVFNKVTVLSFLGAMAAYFYFPILRLAKFPTFGVLIFKSTKGAVVALPFLILGLLAIPFELKKLKLPILAGTIIPRLGILLISFLLVNLFYITTISINLGKPTLSGKYAFLGSSHPFTPENDRLTTWAQDIWSIDFPNYHSPYYDSTKTLPLMWKHVENSVEAFLKRSRTNWDFYGNDNVFTNNEIRLILLGFLAAIVQKRFITFALYLLAMWFISFIFVSYFMDSTIRYIAFAYPTLYTGFAFAIVGIGQAFARINKLLLPLTLIIFGIFFFDNHVDGASFRQRQGISSNYDQREIGEWLKSQHIDLIMARTEGLSFYSGAKMVYLPAANPQTIIKFAKAWGVEYLVIRPQEASWDYMRPIADPSFSDPDLVLKHQFKDGTLIWKVKLSGEEKLYNFRTTEDVNKIFDNININSQIKM